MKKKLFILFFLFFSSYSYSQNILKGRVIDESGNPIELTTVVLLNPNDSTLKHFGVTNKDGYYQIKAVKNDSYLLQFSYVGMEISTDMITIDRNSPSDLGDKKMVPSSLEEIIIVAEIIPMQFKEDTLEYNTKAFTTRPGASVEELLKKLPGIEVDESGNIKAQGEDVTKVLVDGKEFFGNDPKIAIKNLSAEALDKVQVFDKKSEEAEFSGIDDGVRDKTINLLLNEKHKNGYFGEIKAGYGSNDTYKADGKIYRFSKTVQSAFLGMSNNVNEFGFTHRGDNQYGQQIKGLNTSYAGGLNLSYSNGKTNRYFLSYLKNSNKKDLLETTESENFVEGNIYYQDQEVDEMEKNKPNNIDFGIRHNFDKNNRLIVDGDLTNAKNTLERLVNTNTELNSSKVNNLINDSENIGDELSFGTRISYISKLKGDKLQFKITTNLNYEKDESNLDWINDITIFYSENIIVRNTSFHRNNFTEVNSFRTSPAIVVQLNKLWSVDGGVRISKTNRELSRIEASVSPNNEVDNSFEFKTNYVRPFLSFRRVTNKVYANISFEFHNMNMEKLLNESSDGIMKYSYFLPRFYYRNNYASGRKLDISYRTNYSLPSLNQLFPIQNNINQLNVYKGNIHLKPQYNHSLRLTWTVFDQFSFTSFYVSLRGNYSKDYISWSQSVDDKFIRTTTPINVDGMYNFTSRIDFSTPLRKLGLDLNLNSVESWNENKVIINLLDTNNDGVIDFKDIGLENTNTTLSHSIRLSFENRNRDKWRVNFGGKYTITDTKFSIADRENYNQNSLGYFSSLGYTPSKKWNFDIKADVTNYSSQSFDESVNIPTMGASFSYFFREAEKASITLSAYDLLNKTKGFQQSNSDYGLMRKEWNTLTQYFLLEFRWKFDQTNKGLRK
ncbi:MAG TPA: TonB-dependent receptor [Cytophagales bacterium]|nr:TonB-dependent receptor [Cytophagales bacterium]